MTSAVIIFLREVLEAMLIVCILLGSCSNLGISRRWVGFAALAGMFGALLYAMAFDRITEAFEGVGQEVFNAVLLYTIGLCLAVYGVVAAGGIHGSARPGQLRLGTWMLGCAVMLAITREIAELYLFVSGFVVNTEALPAILLGGTLGTGIGLSMGALIYYAVHSRDRYHNLQLTCIVMVPLAAGMVSQATNYLMQADILPSQLPLWDSSSLISETSIVGELLYAVFSYEATPTPLQAVLYLGSGAAVAAAMVWSVVRSRGQLRTLAAPGN